MARFILDVVSLGKNNDEDIQEIQKKVIDSLSDRIATIIIIDHSHTNQFYTEEDLGSNELTTEQIENFNKVCNSY